MAELPPPAEVAEFTYAVERVRAVGFRDDLTVTEITAPTGLAPHAFALAGEVRPYAAGEPSAYGTGRLVLLHDPDEPAPWNGPWRIVCFAQSPLEPEIGSDPLVADVAWSWLTDALHSRSAAFHSASGTATKTQSKGFGSLAAEGEGAQLELRASWSPEGDPTGHVEAWGELVCMLAGLPPGSEGIETVGSRRIGRG